MEKSGKILENCNADLERQMSITLLITHEFVTVNILPVYDTKHLKFKVQKFEASSVVRIDEYIV